MSYESDKKIIIKNINDHNVGSFNTTLDVIKNVAKTFSELFNDEIDKKIVYRFYYMYNYQVAEYNQLKCKFYTSILQYLRKDMTYKECINEYIDTKIYKRKVNEIFEFYSKNNSFENYIKMLNALIYVDYIYNQTKTKEFKSIEIEKLFSKKQNSKIIVLDSTLNYLYNKIIKDERKITNDELILKYNGWYNVMFQRIYKKYEDSNYIVKEIRDDDSGYIFM